MKWWARLRRRLTFDVEAHERRPAWGPRFKTPRDMLFHCALDGETLVQLPGWGGPVYLDSIGAAASDLPAPTAVVIYGSAVRDGARRASDIDVLWLSDAPVAFPRSGNFQANYITCHPSGYGTATYRTKCLHIAVISESEFVRSLEEGTEWATTLLRDGVLLAGPVSFGDARWRRVYALRGRPGGYVDSVSLKIVPIRERDALGVDAERSAAE